MKLGTKIQLYTTVMTAIVVILINLFVYHSYKNFALEAEMDQLENRGINITEEIQNAHANDISTETVLQSYLLSDGFITVVNEDENNVVRISTRTEYSDMGEPYSTSQYTADITHGDMHFAMVSLPIIWDDGSVKNLQIFENVEFLHQTFDILIWVLTVSTVIIIVVIYLLNRVITNTIIGPINKLIDKMRKTEDMSGYTMLEISKKDTKELRELSESFNDMMLDLKLHDENQQAFIMNASHELKTPITVIDSYSQMLNRFGKTREDILDESIVAISDEAQRMKYLTEQLLSFAKVSQQTNHLEIKSIELIGMMESIKIRLEKVYNRQIDVKSNRAAVMVRADADTLDQLLKTFLDNAYKYSHDDIDVEITDEDEHVSVAISDTGIGIPKEDVEHIFTRFYRVDKARARKTGGSGLGLSIARELANMNDVEISVDSEVDVGTTFTLTFRKDGDNDEVH